MPLSRTPMRGHPVPLGPPFEMRKRKANRELIALIFLRSHRFGWEPVLEVDGAMIRTQVCRSSDEVLDTFEQWRSAMLAADWRE